MPLSPVSALQVMKHTQAMAQLKSQMQQPEVQQVLKLCDLRPVFDMYLTPDDQELHIREFVQMFVDAGANGPPVF